MQKNTLLDIVELKSQTNVDDRSLDNYEEDVVELSDDNMGNIKLIDKDAVRID